MEEETGNMYTADLPSWQDISSWYSFHTPNHTFQAGEQNRA